MTMRHAGPLARSEQKAPCHHPVLQGDQAEEKVAIGGVTTGEIGECLSVLWCFFGECYAVQLSGEVHDGGR